MNGFMLGQGSEGACRDGEARLIAPIVGEPFDQSAPAGAQAPILGPFALAGPARVADPRVTPIRGDLADIALAGKLFAPHYVVPLERAVAVAHVALMEARGPEARQGSELLHGERFLLLDIAGEWGWGYGAHDRYLGYLPLSALGDPAAIAPPPPPDGADPVASAEALGGMAYVWGGRGGAGIDCSGLVQVCFARAGYLLPRDADQQEAAAGRALTEAEPTRRGDLLFMPGHVAIAVDDATVIHATRSGGGVIREPLATMLARRGTAITRRRRVLA